MKLKFLFILLALSVTSSTLHSQELGNPSKNNIDSTIFLSEEVTFPLAITNSSVSFNLSSSGKTAVEANSALQALKKKLAALTNEMSLAVVNRSFTGGSGTGTKLSYTTPILITEHITATISENKLHKFLDTIISIPEVSILDIEALKNDTSLSKNQASSKAVNQAIKKAQTIANDQGMLLDGILDITITEEPTTSSIREQLNPDRSNSISNPIEIKIVASLRIKLKAK